MSISDLPPTISPSSDPDSNGVPQPNGAHPDRLPGLRPLLAPIVGGRRADRLLRLVAGAVSATSTADRGSVDDRTVVGLSIPRADLARALGLLLLDDLLARVPVAAAYARDIELDGGRLVFDHGAVRGVAREGGRPWGLGLPSGAAAFARLLEPLGYRRTAVYPLTRLGMTGYAYTQLDDPEGLPQFFVSELHPERFSPAFSAAVDRVLASSVDPWTADAVARLDVLRDTGALSIDDAQALLPELMASFARHHDEPTLEDYEILRRESAEMAWIATEGHQFNHITDRVSDLAAVAEAQRRLGRGLKDRIEVSGSGRVRQTAFRAATVDRLFRDSATGRFVVRSVPGSFHEMIQRDRLPTGELDLAFDAANATGIFAMTESPVQS